MSSATGKLVESQVARRGRFDELLTHGADAAYWLSLWTEEELELRVAGQGDGADYTVPEPRAASPEAVIAASLGVVEDLRGLRPTGPRARKLCDLMVEQAAEPLRELLLERPDLHETVVEDVRRRGIPRMPWAVVNRGRATQLALLFGYPPFLDPSSITAAKRLTQLGRITDVVSQDISTLRKQDPGATRIAREYVDRSVMLPGVRRFNDWGSVRGYVEDALAQVSELEAADSRTYESMYSRALAAHSHFAAALVKLRSPELHWVAEFSDPLLRNAHGGWREEQMEDDWLRRRLAGAFKASGYDVPEGNRIFEWAELIAYAWADEIIFTNRNQLDFMLGYCAHPALAERAATVSRATHHPVPPAHLYEVSRPRYALPPSKVHIGYFGNFYVNRGLEDLTSALRGLSAADRARVQLHIFTDEPETLVLETLEHGLSDVITVNPLLGYAQYLNILTRFDVLLITDFATRAYYDPNPYLPSKLSDYRGSGSSIWAMYEPGSVLSTEVTDHATELGDAEGAARVLRELLTKAGERGRWRQVFGEAAELHSS